MICRICPGIGMLSEVSARAGVDVNRRKRRIMGVMQPKTTYPRWFHSFRGFVIGLALGCATTTLAYELKVIPVGDAIWKSVFFPLAINGAPWIVLALFEIYFGVRRYRALRREMDGRTGAPTE
jgi:hypothetical protein